MKTILEHLSRFDTEGHTEPPPLEIPPLTPVPPRVRVVYENMRAGQYGYPTETTRRPEVLRCADRRLLGSSYRGRSFWVDVEEDSVPELPAAPDSSSDPTSIPTHTWYDSAMWHDEVGPSIDLTAAYARLVAAADASSPLASFVPGHSYGNPVQWRWSNIPQTPEPNAQPQTTT